MHNEGSELVNDQLLSLACGPDRRVYRYKSFLLNGWRFNTRDRDLHLKSQNSGIFVKGDDSTGNLDYFGTLTDIIQLNYLGESSVILFKGDWWDVYHKSGYKVDKFGFPMVNITKKLKTDESYVLASQVQQVYYVKDIKEPNWMVVVKTKPRDLFDLPDDGVGDEPCQVNEDFGFTFQESTSEPDIVSMKRFDLASETVNGNPIDVDIVGAEEEEEDETNNDCEFTDDDSEINPVNENISSDDDDD